MFATFFLTSATGWVSALLIAVTTAIPYVLGRRGPNSSLQQLGPFLIRLRLHYWLGYIILVLSIVHAAFSMTRATFSGSQSLGLFLAMGAFVLLFCQLVLGLNLSNPTQGRRGLRRWHFRAMLGVAVLGLGHIVLNSALIGVLIP